MEVSHDLTGLVNGQQVSILDDDGFALNAGIAATYYATDSLLFPLEVR